MSNWPMNDDRSSTNWTGRTKRNAGWSGNLDPNKIPVSAWLGAIAVVSLFFFFSLAGQILTLDTDENPTLVHRPVLEMPGFTAIHEFSSPKE